MVSGAGKIVSAWELVIESAEALIKESQKLIEIHQQQICALQNITQKCGKMMQLEEKLVSVLKINDNLRKEIDKLKG